MGLIKKEINISPVLTPKDQELIELALGYLAGRDYALIDDYPARMFDDLRFSKKEYERLNKEASACVKLRSKLENLYWEKWERRKKRKSSRRRESG